MHTDRFVKVLLCGSSFHGNSYELNHFSRGRFQDVTTDYFLGLPLHNQLHESSLPHSSESMLHRFEVSFVYVNLLVLLSCLLLGQAASPDHRIGENRCWYILVVHISWLIPIERIREAVALCQRDRSQLNTISNITNGVNVGDVCLAPLVDLDLAVRSELDAYVLETNTAAFRGSSSCIHNLINFEDATVPKSYFEGSVFLLFDLLNVRIEFYINSSCYHLIPKALPDVSIEAPKKQISSVQLRYFGSIAVEHVCKLDCDVTPSDDEEPLRNIGQEKHFVRSYDMLTSWEVWHLGPPSSCDENSFSAIGLVPYCDCMFVFQSGSAIDYLDAGAAKYIAVNSVQS
mmetsp:Transcript_11914/g.49717  ORF Transcript_11914/g.49717 Transcript_11914/m.49717 type:complete len:344 (-) Transcript_11914:517-1548(-)